MRSKTVWWRTDFLPLSMIPQRRAGDFFALARGYGLTSLVAILITALALAILYRQLAIRTIVDFGEQSNVTVARTTLSAMLPELAGLLQTTDPDVAAATVDDVPAGLLTLLRTTVRDTPIARIKIYNRDGAVLYSTREREIGTISSANPRFQASIGGQVRSVLSYRDVFNGFHVGTDDANLIETYVPIYRPGDHQPIGVLELYTDVNPIVRAMSRNTLMILAGIAVIMVVLYSLLLYAVRRGERIIADQRGVILERNHTLELLSARMLHTEEAERRRVAWELHEDIAQTLSAAKLKIDALANAAAQSEPPSGPVSSREIVSLVQSAIGEVRALAMDLRPPDLDHFGLIPTTRSLCREAEQIHGHLGISTDFSVQEEDIPELLKSVIFRITQQTLKRLVGIPEIRDICVALKREEGLQLAIDFSTGTNKTSEGDNSDSFSDDRTMAALWDRAVLAGGSFSAGYTDAGRFLYEATWIL